MSKPAKTVFLLSAALLLPTWAQAQKTPKKLGKAVQKAVSGAAAPKGRAKAAKTASASELLIPNPEWNASSPAAKTTGPATTLQLPVRQWERAEETAKPLSFVEKKELTEQLELLNELRRSIIKDPAIIVKPKFAKQMESLNKLGIKMPEVSPIPANVSRAEQQQFVQDLQNRLETAINEAETAISSRLGYPSHKLNFQQVLAANRKDLLHARGRHEQKWPLLEEAIKNNTPSFSWGAPGMDLIEVQPLAVLPGKNSLQNAAESLVSKLAGANPKTLGSMLDLILYAPNADRYKKMELMQHVSGVSELLGYNFVREYLNAFRSLPAVNNVFAGEYTNYRLLDKYARGKLARLIENKTSDALFAQEDAKAFLILTSLVEYETSRAAIAAITHGESDAALWLLRYGTANATSRKITAYMESAYSPKPTNVIASTIVRKPVAKPNIPAYDKEAHQNALEMRLDVLASRIENTSREIDNLTKRVNNLSRHIEDVKNTPGATFTANNTESQLWYFRTERAKLDLRVTRLKDLSKKLRVELKEVYADLQELTR